MTCYVSSGTLNLTKLNLTNYVHVTEANYHWIVPGKKWGMPSRATLTAARDL